ncbi:MAG: hypothetical protein E6G41_15935 [Actinobacteria bacterium]|nr:MAG: hypothetical protein E6G41_15935 [Actinomycetota bacterium]
MRGGGPLRGSINASVVPSALNPVVLASSATAGTTFAVLSRRCRRMTPPSRRSLTSVVDLWPGNAT